MIVHNIDPVLLNIFGLEIRYYGLVYVLGFIFVLFFLDYYRKKGKLELSKDEIYDYLFYLILGVVVGSRLLEVLLWNPSFYFSNPLEILMVWKGGMSVHGGIIGLIIANYLFCKKKKIGFYELADLVAIPGVFILAVGRIANFINAELVGTVSNLPWCVDFGDKVCRHPVQIYSFLKRTLIGVVLVFVNKGEHKPGFIFWLFIGLMGLGRLLIDFVREDARWSGLSLGQYLSLVMLVVAGYALVTRYKKDIKFK